MARAKLRLVREDFEQEVRQAQQMINAMRRARTQGSASITQKHYENVIELCYLRTYLGWETFLEQSFLLYMLGKTTGTNKPPARYVLPQNRQHAMEFSRGDQQFADWTAADRVVARARRFFKDGQPYDSELRNITQVLNDMKTVRNAIAHHSEDTQDRFKSLVRRELGYMPGKLSVGGFLQLTSAAAPGVASYWEHYTAFLLQAAQGIVPR